MVDQTQWLRWRLEEAEKKRLAFELMRERKLVIPAGAVEQLDRTIMNYRQQLDATDPNLSASS